MYIPLYLKNQFEDVSYVKYSPLLFFVDSIKVVLLFTSVLQKVHAHSSCHSDWNTVSCMYVPFYLEIQPEDMPYTKFYF